MLLTIKSFIRKTACLIFKFYLQIKYISDMEIPYAVGYDITGKAIIADVAKFPHLLVGGTSGFGKSSALHSLLMSIDEYCL